MHRKDVLLMNDFAKEELIDLSLMLSELADISRDNLIYIKILKMIDNYEHKHQYKEIKESFIVTDYTCDICGENLIER